MKNTLSAIETRINEGLAASSITWAKASGWSKETINAAGEKVMLRRIYVNVGAKADGYVAVAEDGTLTIPAKGTGSIFSRIALAGAMKSIVAAINAEQADAQ